MRDLKTLSCDDFSGLVNQTFITVLEADRRPTPEWGESKPMAFDLVEAKVLKPVTSIPERIRKRFDIQRDPFALLFKGPAGVRLPQGTYRVQHDQLGEVGMFMVPVGSDVDDQPDAAPDPSRERLLLEAIFS